MAPGAHATCATSLAKGKLMLKVSKAHPDRNGTVEESKRKDTVTRPLTISLLTLRKEPSLLHTMSCHTLSEPSMIPTENEAGCMAVAAL